MKRLILILAFVSCGFSFASIFGQSWDYYKKMTPAKLEAWIWDELPHVPGFFDCSERADFARKALRRMGCSARNRVYLPKGKGMVKHNSVLYDCERVGMGKGEILDI